MKPDMAKLPGLFPRNGVWYLRVVIPHELSTVYASKRAIVESLRTKDVLQAKVKATIRRATLLAGFEQQLRELHPQAVERVTPEMGKMLAERVTARILGVDERLRKEPETARLLMEAIRPFRSHHSLAIGPYEPPEAPPASAPLDPLQGMPRELMLELAETNRGTTDGTPPHAPHSTLVPSRTRYQHIDDGCDVVLQEICERSTRGDPALGSPR